MKRYWLSIALVAFIILCIGTFYIVSAASLFPQFKLTTQLGSEEVEEVSLRGIYSRQEHRGPSVIISSTGSEYADRQTIFERMDSSYWSRDEMRQLDADHRQFMRGKYTEYSLYQDDQYLAYVNVNEGERNALGGQKFNYTVSVLDKDQNKTSTFEAPLLDGDKFQYIWVSDVQVFGDEIIVMMHGRPIEGSQQYVRASFNLHDGKLLTQQSIDFSQFANTDEDMNLNVTRANDTNITKSSKYTAYYIVESSMAEVNDEVPSDQEVNANNQSVQQEIVSTKVIFYDIQTGQLEQLISPELSHFLSSYASASTWLSANMENNILYLTLMDSAGIRIFEYSLANGTAHIHEYEVDNETVELYKIKNRLLHVMTKDSNNGASSLVSVNLDTDETVYRGSIELSGGTDEDQIDALKRLDINEIIVR